MRQLLLVLVLVPLLALPAGCARGGAPSPPEGEPAQRLLVGLGLEGGSGPSRRAFSAGQPVTLVLFLENRGTAPVRVTYPSGQRYDFVVSRDGQEVWRWSAAAGRAFTQAVVEEEVAPGERHVYREVWRGVDTAGQPLPPGTYQAVGIVPLTPRPIESPPLALELEAPSS